MTARGTPSRFLASVLHNGLGRYVQQLQRLSFSVSRDGPSSRGAREFVEREVIDFARRNPGVVIYVNSRPCCVPRVVAEYLNGAVREESIHCKSVEEISTLVQKLANQSGLDVIRIRKPFHTDNPSIQGQWHPFTNKSTTFHGLRPREVQDPASAQLQDATEFLGEGAGPCWYSIVALPQEHVAIAIHPSQPAGQCHQAIGHCTADPPARLARPTGPLHSGSSVILIDLCSSSYAVPSSLLPHGPCTDHCVLSVKTA
uniref:Large ribosomal subunit protein mL43 n=1 Tax=Saimiri boliviensis boliviensis TaxID=39432 RepID=A0A2K6SU99_SAIBB